MGKIRRHGAELDAAIESAVLELVTRHGAAGVTMDAVAAAAKTSKPVLYRRWPDSRSMLRDVLLRMVIAVAAPSVDTGSYRSDMLAVLRAWKRMFTGPRGPAMRAVIATMSHDAVLAEAFRNGVISWRRKEMAALLDRGIARGDVRADVPTDIVWSLAQSVLFHRLLISGEPITDELVVRLVDELLVPFVAPHASAQPKTQPTRRRSPARRNKPRRQDPIAG
ncbi:TetR/AcrR family transcriptional regulator [Mycobacterium cookii]|uniref:Putative HTH-type transcriptional regulator n=1 Tax=Mycobacterium cookii TaxID=1775 RepID=A0A7I7L423_9MYCO|nr:TetR/AcrR family transcriptional regulator [Mycobacterium cookii]MCV7329609.1 TetR/AcrR family transcriptional regulator [Mycobacterium cookii]BBX48551.1 putative HTH-type transcriptional regulator [Mycobacterium cookii]